MKILKFVSLLFLAVLLSILTQIGGVLLLLSYVLYRKSKWKVFLCFCCLYLLSTFVLVPIVAPHFGREKIKTNSRIKIHTFFTQLTNRNYVKPQMNDVLARVSLKLQQSLPDTTIHCLDANFPFWDGFPLLPHLSHNDGKKLDISLVYQDAEGSVVNDIPSRSGYGIFEGPQKGEYDQVLVCLDKGYWQYDYAKYLTLGTMHKDLTMSTTATSSLVSQFLQENAISKVFIEPHLRSRMNLTHPKLRYHGCKAVRHDDHIHLQIK